MQSNEIAKLEKECQELERNVLDLSTNIDTTKEEENKKLKEASEKHKTVIDEIKEGNQKLKSEIQNALEKK